MLAKIGIAPIAKIAFSVAANELSGTITSSPALIPAAFSAILIASVPLPPVPIQAWDARCQ